MRRRWGIVLGVGPDTYRSSGTVTRGQVASMMAMFLVRSLDRLVRVGLVKPTG